MDIDIALKCCYELEGLLLLKKQREDTAPAGIDELIDSKISAIRSALSTYHTRQPIEEVCYDAAATENAIFEEENGAKPATPDIPEIPSDEPLNHATNIKPVFTLNDKFRFIRDLFGGNSSLFDEAVAESSIMNSTTDVKDYLVNDLCLDESIPEIDEFVAFFERND